MLIAFCVISSSNWLSYIGFSHSGIPAAASLITRRMKGYLVLPLFWESGITTFFPFLKNLPGTADFWFQLSFSFCSSERKESFLLANTRSERSNYGGNTLKLRQTANKKGLKKVKYLHEIMKKRLAALRLRKFKIYRSGLATKNISPIDQVSLPSQTVMTLTPRLGICM